MPRGLLGRLVRRSPAQAEIRSLIRQLPTPVYPASSTRPRFAIAVTAFFYAFAMAMLAGFAAMFVFCSNRPIVDSGWQGVVGTMSVVLVITFVVLCRYLSVGAIWDDHAPPCLRVSHWAPPKGEPTGWLQRSPKRNKWPCRAKFLMLLWAQGSYDYYELYRSLEVGATAKERWALRQLCEAGTLDLLRLDVAGVRPGSLTVEVRKHLDARFQAAKDLVEAIHQAMKARQAEVAAEEARRLRRGRKDTEQTKTEALASLEAECGVDLPDPVLQAAADMVAELGLQTDRHQRITELLNNDPA